jgi:F0F1-type ATP synthase assembly protein I
MRMSDSPNPDGPTSGDGGRESKKNPWVQVARYSQVALMLPAGTVGGWLLGSLLDRWLHTSWIAAVGLVLGIAAGMTELIRTLLRDMK